MIGFNPNLDEDIGVFPWPDPQRLSDIFPCTVGACNMSLHDLSPQRQALQMMAELATILANTNLSRAAIHKAFLEIDEYRWLLSSDSNGSEDAPDWFWSG